MCGIVGFTGKQPAAPILLDGLSKLEYRGYDSAGLAVRDGEALAEVVKAKGRLTNLVEKTDAGKALKGAVVLDIPAGLPMVSPARSMHILMFLVTAVNQVPVLWSLRSLVYITVSLRITQN